jgi:hypothetical protein
VFREAENGEALGDVSLHPGCELGRWLAVFFHEFGKPFFGARQVGRVEDGADVTGNGGAQTIVNDIDLAGEGGLVWEKDRNNTNGHHLWDTARGAFYLASQSTAAQAASSGFTFNSNGFTIPAPFGNVDTHASWTFRKQPKFFDVVTYTGTGVARTVAHNLGSVPGCIIVKRTDTAGFDWLVYHRSTGNTNRLLLNDTAAAASGTSFWNDTTPTSTVFTVGTNVNGNASGGTYVAYIYAHDAGGFGLTGTDNVISCGSFTTDGSGNATVNLGYEPQWIMYRRSASSDNWRMVDSMRGFDYLNYTRLSANLADIEAVTAGDYIHPTATGFATTGAIGTSTEVIYIAIRRGPMAVPELGTTVFAPVTFTSASPYVATTGFPVDLVISRFSNTASNPRWVDRLRGG